MSVVENNLKELKELIDELNSISSNVSTNEDINQIKYLLLKIENISRSYAHDSIDENESEVVKEYSSMLKSIDGKISRMVVSKDTLENQLIELDGLNLILENLIEVYKATKKTLKQIKEENEDNFENEQEYENAKEQLKQTREKIKNLKAEIEEKEKAFGVKWETVIDLNKEAERIIDSAFKKNEIKDELDSRNISREEYIEFYKNIADFSNNNLDSLNQEKDKLIKSENEFFIDQDTGENLLDRIKIKDVDIDLDEHMDTLLQYYEKIRLNFINQGYDISLLINPIQTKGHLEAFRNFIISFELGKEMQLNELDNKIAEAKQDLEIAKQMAEEFGKNEIAKIEKEQKIIDAVKNGAFEEIDIRAENEKHLREKQIRADIYGDEELKKEFEKRFKRFYDHKTEKTVKFVDDNGEEKEIPYNTVDTYPEYIEDAYFLNLSDYRSKLMISSLYRNSGNNPKVLGEDFIKKAEKQGKTVEEIIKEQEKYINSFNGQTNKYRIKAENHLTSGSSLKSMSSIQNLPLSKKVGTSIENVFRFFGIRKPRFTKTDEKGNKQRDIKGGLLTTAVDAAVIGAVSTAGIVGGTWGLATVGFAYAARGTVIIANRLIGKHMNRKHNYSIKNNIPTPYDSSKDAREVARKDYYRRVDGKGKFSSWIKAKADRLTPDKAKITEEKIIKEKIAEMNKAIDKRTENAKQALRDNLIMAEKNQKIREKNYLSFQNDKDFSLLQKAEEMKKIKIRGDTTPSTAISEEQKYIGRQQKQDRINTVATIILTTFGRAGLDSLKNSLMNTSVDNQAIVDEVTTQTVYDTKTIVKLPNRITKLKLDRRGLSNVYNGDRTKFSGDVVSIANAEYSNNPIGAAIHYITKDGKEIVASIAEKGKGLKEITHVHAVGDFDMSKMSSGELMKKFAELDSNSFNAIIKDLGFKDNLTQKAYEKIASRLIRGGNLNIHNQGGAWQAVLGGKENIIKIVKKIPRIVETHTKSSVLPTVNQPDKISIIESAYKSAIVGSEINIVDNIHEAASQTSKTDHLYNHLSENNKKSKVNKAKKNGKKHNSKTKQLSTDDYSL